MHRTCKLESRYVWYAEMAAITGKTKLWNSVRVNFAGANLKLSGKLRDLSPTCNYCRSIKNKHTLQTAYTLSEAWSGVNWGDLMAAQAPLGPIFMTGLPER